MIRLAQVEVGSPDHAMSPEQRQALEAQADRSRRRGELGDALLAYQTLLAAFPDDSALAIKISELKANLQPMELMSAKAAFRDDAAHGPVPSTPEQEGERLFAIGDYLGAAAAYRRAVRDRPESELLQERLVELYRLAQAAPRSSPTDQALPRATEPMLRALLDRISSRKRVGG